MKVFVIISLVLFSVLGVNAQITEDLPQIDKTFSISAHIIVDSDGVSIHSPTSIANGVIELNKYFARIGVDFEVTCSIDTIPNYWYTNFDTLKRHYAEIQVLYNDDNRINIYFVNQISGPVGAGGFAGLGCIAQMNTGAIIISTMTSLPHEMGHFFGLLHTFDEKNGAERVNGFECETRGDGICDTPADPYSSAGVMIDANCKFISTVTDVNGDFYDPIICNTMSYYGCLVCTGTVADFFTRGQYKKMAETYLANPKMW